jgi:hypothetical protein
MDLAAQLGSIFSMLLKVFIVVLLPAGLFLAAVGLALSSWLVKKRGKSERFADTVNNCILFFGACAIVIVIYCLVNC